MVSAEQYESEPATN
jgi:hypothetical protein